MGFHGREKKRRKKAAMAAAQRSARLSGSSSRKWWLTLVTRNTCCARCSGVLRVKREMVYRHTPREALCKLCADCDPTIRYRPSKQWEDERRRVRALGREAKIEMNRRPHA